LLSCASAHGQFPDKFENLKILPKDISKQELQSTMRGFAFALGVRCDHCHVEKKEPGKGFDFPADDKQAKQTARLMIQMVDAINHDFVGKVVNDDKTTPIRVQCVSCHHGVTRPQPLNAVLAQCLEKDGIGRRSPCTTTFGVNTTVVVSTISVRLP
jgi:hypothetical protein